jgi:hypothetical protein
VSHFQFFIRDKRNVALMMAGLPANVLQMFQEVSTSFSRRAFRRKLEAISIPEIRATMLKTVELSGREIGGEALTKMAQATNGLAFLIQLIGYHTFNQSDEKTITTQDVEAGIADARADMESTIIEATVYSLSDKDIDFLKAMACDADISHIADIAQRLGVQGSYASTYRKRLLDQGIIMPAGRGRLQFAVPMLKEWLLENM